MIYLYQNKINTVVTRFFDRRQRSDTYFLWKIENYISKKTTYFITDDTSPNRCAYNLFNITLSPTGDEDGGIDIPLNLEPGHNTYTVFETTEFSLDEDKVIGTIEKDIIFVEVIRGANTATSNITDIYY